MNSLRNIIIKESFGKIISQGIFDESKILELDIDIIYHDEVITKYTSLKTLISRRFPFGNQIFSLLPHLRYLTSLKLLIDSKNFNSFENIFKRLRFLHSFEALGS